MAEPDPRELDVMVSLASKSPCAMTSLALMELGIKAKSYTGAQVKILTDDAHLPKHVFWILMSTILNKI